MRRTVLVLGLGALVAVAAPAAVAAPKPKPITKTYAVQAPLPYPTSFATGDAGCILGPESLTRHTEPFTFPAKGTMVVSMAGFNGDWDLYLVGATGKVLASSEGDQLGVPSGGTEKLTYKKATAKQAVTIVACNWLGGPNASVTYTFTYA